MDSTVQNLEIWKNHLNARTLLQIAKTGKAVLRIQPSTGWQGGAKKLQFGLVKLKKKAIISVCTQSNHLGFLN